MKILITLLLLVAYGNTQAQTDTVQSSSPDSAIYRQPEIAAEYPGGIPAWMRYLTKNFRYPEKAQVKNIQGTIVTQFIVDSTGLVHDIAVVSGPEEFHQECIRLIEKTKLWMPAVNNGKKVNSWKTQVFNFRLEN